MVLARLAGDPPFLAHGARIAVLGLTLAAAVAWGHDGRRAVQVGLLALPVLVWCCWPLKHRGLVWLRAGLVVVTLVVFGGDAVVRHHLQQTYQAAPDSALVLTAVANTSWREAREYLAGQSAVWLPWLAAALLMGLALWRALRGGLAPPPLSRRSRWVLLALLLLGGMGYASKPWRKHHPLLFWPSWAQQVLDTRAQLADRLEWRQQMLAHAQAAAPTVALEGPATVVLVLSDSLNRDNMGLYGYARPTTPQLEGLRAALGPQWLQIPHAWSTAPGTLASLEQIFGFGAGGPSHGAQPPNPAQHVIALARAAGYRVWWLSNHDDLGIEQQHARLADEVRMVSRQPGRSTASLDGQVLPLLVQALGDAAPRKLIIVHLLGAHPHYRLRRPQGEHPFDDSTDSVDARMAAAGRPLWLRELRQDYDAAIRYHDSVVAETLRLTVQAQPTTGYGAWMFLSDHGQEVGHTLAQAGHSPATAAGYRIPAVLWRSAPAFAVPQPVAPFRSDWTAWTLAELLQLRWSGRRPSHDVTSPAYRWEPPRLPVAVARFDE